MNRMGLITAFRNAARGFYLVVRTTPNFRIQMGCFVIALLLLLLLPSRFSDWVAILGVSALVFVSEIINTALEELCNHVTPEQHHAIRNIKDIAAAAPLIASVFALIVGCLIFGPKVMELF